MTQIKHMQTEQEIQTVKEISMQTTYRRMMQAVEHEHREMKIAERKMRIFKKERRYTRSISITGVVLGVLIILFVLFH